jgi:uncharacterized membrane protein YphA (DoxX/SURF4 family)
MEKRMNFARHRTNAWRPRFLWAGSIILSLIFLVAAGAKVAGVPQIVDLFTQIGLGQWFRYLTAALEAGGAVLLLIPSMRQLGAALLAAVMAGAIITNFVLCLNPMGAVVLLLAAIAIGLAQRTT